MNQPFACGTNNRENIVSQADAQLNENGFSVLVGWRRTPETFRDPAFLGVLFFHGRFPIICSGRPTPQRTRSLKTFLFSCVTLLVGHSPGAWQYHMFSIFPIICSAGEWPILIFRYILEQIVLDGKPGEQIMPLNISKCSAWQPFRQSACRAACGSP